MLSRNVIMRAANALRLNSLATLAWKGRLVVLMYHYFCPDDATPTSLICRQSDFECHLRYLKKNYNVLPLPDAMDRITRGQPLPERSVALTVDDVGMDFKEYAWPAIRRHQVPVTLAVCPGFSDRSDERSTLFGMLHAHMRARGDGATRYEDCYELFYNRPLSELKGALAEFGVGPEDRPDLPGSVNLPLLDFDWLVQAHRTGLVEIASHTLTHPALARVRGEWLRWEIEESAARIRNVFGHCNLFFYPGGGRTDPPALGRELLVQSGYRYAFTVEPAILSGTEDPYQCGRLSIDGTEGTTGLEFRVSGILPVLRRRLKR